MRHLLKKELRQELKQKRKQLDQTFRTHAEDLICKTVLGLKAFQKAQTIGLYHAFQGEVETKSIWHHALKMNKTCYFPILQNNKNLLFLPADDNTEWEANHFGILEPKVSLSKALPATQLDLIFLPLVGFDIYGHRLGMGAGYYDRALAGNSDAILAGLGYDFQKVSCIETELWDVPLDLIITNTKLYWSKK